MNIVELLKSHGIDSLLTINEKTTVSNEEEAVNYLKIFYDSFIRNNVVPTSITLDFNDLFTAFKKRHKLEILKPIHADSEENLEEKVMCVLNRVIHKGDLVLLTYATSAKKSCQYSAEYESFVSKIVSSFKGLLRFCSNNNVRIISTKKTKNLSLKGCPRLYLASEGSNSYVAVIMIIRDIF